MVDLGPITQVNYDRERGFTYHPERGFASLPEGIEGDSRMPSLEGSPSVSVPVGFKREEGYGVFQYPESYPPAFVQSLSNAIGNYR
jgi:hypothetical protein